MERKELLEKLRLEFHRINYTTKLLDDNEFIISSNSDQDDITTINQSSDELQETLEYIRTMVN